MSEIAPGGWDRRTAQRFTIGFGLGALSTLAIGIQITAGTSRTARIPFIVGIAIGFWAWSRAYQAAGRPAGKRGYFIGRDAVAAAGWSRGVWDVLALAHLVGVALPLVHTVSSFIL